MENLTPQQALMNLYQAARLAPLTAPQHEIIVQSAKLLEDFIQPKKEETPLPKK